MPIAKLFAVSDQHRHPSLFTNFRYSGWGDRGVVPELSQNPTGNVACRITMEFDFTVHDLCHLSGEEFKPRLTATYRKSPRCRRIRIFGDGIPQQSGTFLVLPRCLPRLDLPAARRELARPGLHAFPDYAGRFPIPTSTSRCDSIQNYCVVQEPGRTGALPRACATRIDFPPHPQDRSADKNPSPARKAWRHLSSVRSRSEPPLEPGISHRRKPCGVPDRICGNRATFAGNGKWFQGNGA